MVQSEKRKTNRIWLVLFSYWLVLLLWQNLRTVGNRGSIDVAVKALLLGVLVVVCLLYSHSIKRSFVLFVCGYFIILTATKMTGGRLSTDEYLYYYYPLLMLLMLCGFGARFTIDKKQLLCLCNCLIVTVAYLVLYALLFQTERFANAADVTNAYGNELSSLLKSSHEYGLYLAFGSMAALLCLELNERIKPWLRGVYILAFVVFVLNLILTFSRTSIVAFLILLLCYLFAFSKTKIRTVFFCVSLAVLLLIAVIRPLREYFVTVVFKNNTDAGRGKMIAAGWDIFLKSDLFEMLFGHNRRKAQLLLLVNYGHLSFHNAYIQILVTNGICGIAFFGTVIFAVIRKIYCTLKERLQWRALTILLYGFLGAACFYMMTQTTVILSSSIDSFFITVFGIAVPLYVCNAIRDGIFGEEPPKAEKPNRASYRRR